MTKNFQTYTTDNKVIHYSKEEDINRKLEKIIGNKFIEYRKKWDQANKMEIITDFPLFLHIDMNQECNYKCPHCIIGHKSEVEKYYSDINLNFDDYKKIIDEGAEYGCPSVNPQGNNEPFLDKNFERFLEYPIKKGFLDVMVNNNGSAINKKRAKSVIETGVTRVRFSLDAFTQQTYEKVRVGSIPLERVIKNIEDFVEMREKLNSKLPVIGVSFCKVKANEHEVNDFINFWKDKVDFISIQKFMTPTLNKKKFEKYYASDQYVEKKPDLFYCVQPYQRIMFRNEYMYPCCPSFNKDLNLGSIRNKTIYSAWHSDKMKKIREIHKSGEYYKDKTCNDCVDLIYPVEEKL